MTPIITKALFCYLEVSCRPIYRQQSDIEQSFPAEEDNDDVPQRREIFPNYRNRRLHHGHSYNQEQNHFESTANNKDRQCFHDRKLIRHEKIPNSFLRPKVNVDSLNSYPRKFKHSRFGSGKVATRGITSWPGAKLMEEGEDCLEEGEDSLVHNSERQARELHNIPLITSTVSEPTVPSYLTSLILNKLSSKEKPFPSVTGGDKIFQPISINQNKESTDALPQNDYKHNAIIDSSDSNLKKSTQNDGIKSDSRSMDGEIYNKHKYSKSDRQQSEVLKLLSGDHPVRSKIPAQNAMHGQVNKNKIGKHSGGEEQNKGNKPNDTGKISSVRNGNNKYSSELADNILPDTKSTDLHKLSPIEKSIKRRQAKDKYAQFASFKAKLGRAPTKLTSKYLKELNKKLGKSKIN